MFDVAPQLRRRLHSLMLLSVNACITQGFRQDAPLCDEIFTQNVNDCVQYIMLQEWLGRECFCHHNRRYWTDSEFNRTLCILLFIKLSYSVVKIISNIMLFECQYNVVWLLISETDMFSEGEENKAIDHMQMEDIKHKVCDASIHHTTHCLTSRVIHSICNDSLKWCSINSLCF